MSQIAVAATICATTITPKLFQQQAIAQGAPNLVQGELTAPSGSKPFGERKGWILCDSTTSTNVKHPCRFRKGTICWKGL